MNLALIAGAGRLPATLAAALAGRDWRAWHLEGFAPEGLASVPFRVETLGSLIATLRAEGVSEVCFAGRIARPELNPSALDMATVPLVPRMMQALGQGDDAALRTVIAFFEEAGLRIVAPQDLAPGLLDVPNVGAPSERDRADIARAVAVHRALAPLDVGQGCVVARGQVLAVEAMPGTDWMLESLGRIEGRPGGGVLYKAAKAGQDRRIDMATIGPETVTRAAQAGLAGIAVAAGDVLVLDPDALRHRLAATGLFLAPA
ncbi:UDP-2,3-diacylglucosamine diphosphatase LpxI [uncultured Jannaschia sp.]|uniref:LpxI family protein n=1 Tax=uncultured Jannaschia sp. TaxID=293347 RepID=UPI00260C1A4C|nr:UDP-2,3-diacylglucosamine diphosphatase LpxI [uncultured Jannaschia sp.]